MSVDLKQLKERLEDKGLLVSWPEGIKDIENITYDSRLVKDNTLFICKGLKFNVQYLEDSIAKGATAYLSENDYKVKIPVIIVNDVRKALAIVSAVYYTYEADKLKLIGITGTAGKTTVAYMINSILNAHENSRTGLITTVECYDGTEAVEANMTTPESMELQRMFRNMVDNDVHYATMEVTSQSYKMDRVYGLNFDVGIFLNISPEHISPIEHESFEEYLECKLQLMKNSKTAIISAETQEFETVEKTARANCDKTIIVGFKPEVGDIWYQDVKKLDLGYSFVVKDKEGWILNVKIANDGDFNIKNAMIAIATARNFGVDDKAICEGLENVMVPGRMNAFRHHGSNVYVDYAHNKESLEALLKWLHEEFPDKTVNVVMGSAGRANYVRRNQIGDALAGFADFAYLTEEDPEYEDPQVTCEDLAKRIKGSKCRYEIITNREEAIKTAMNRMTDKDVVAILGKGTERFTKLNGKYLPCKSDADIVMENQKK